MNRALFTLTFISVVSTPTPPCMARQRMLGLQNESHLDPERWSKAEPTPALVKEELQLPHKTPIGQGREPFKLEWKET